MPGTFEIWFLSPQKHAHIVLPKQIRFIATYAQFKPTCQPYGDYCFDPQIGLYKANEKSGEYTLIGDEASEIKNEAPKEELKAEFSKDRAKSIMDNSLIDCKKDNFFDIYCGREKKEKTKSETKLEVWIDTSSSFKDYDPSDKSDGCKRRSFMISLQSECKDGGVDFYSFNTNKNYQTNPDNFCLNHGLNDEKRLMRWIEESNAPHLIIITDITEYTAKLDDFVKANNGFIKGAQTEDLLTPDKMNDLVSGIAKYCKKK